MSIEKNQTTEESVDPANTELSKEEAENTAGGIRRGGTWEGGEGGDPGDTGKELKYL